jgi:hypothetical protein
MTDIERKIADPDSYRATGWTPKQQREPLQQKDGHPFQLIMATLLPSQQASVHHNRAV